jgi:hypothetical protein
MLFVGRGIGPWQVEGGGDWEEQKRKAPAGDNDGTKEGRECSLGQIGMNRQGDWMEGELVKGSQRSCGKWQQEWPREKGRGMEAGCRLGMEREGKNGG